jgi:hypothetical protein
MKTIHYKINTIPGRIHVERLEHVVPMLRKQGLIKEDDLLQPNYLV